MKKIFFYAFLLVTSGAFVSCSGNSRAESVAPPLQSESAPDTASLSPESAVAEAPETKETAETVNAAPDLSTRELQLVYMHSDDKWDKYRTGILPTMAEEAPDYCRQILETGTRFIIVDKGKMKLFLYDPYGNIEKSYGIACAKNYGTKRKKGDSRTTEGIFNVKGVFDSTDWLFTNDNGYTSPTRGQYGPRFIRLTIPYIGIHGTGSPGSIGRRCSHGCIRVTNPNILELVKYVEPGMPVIISPGPRDMAVNKREGNKVLSVTTEPGTSRAVAGGYVEQPQSSSNTSASASSDKADETPKPTEEKTEDAAPEAEPATPAAVEAAPAEVAI